MKREEKEEEEGDSGVRCCDRPCHSALTRTCTSLGSRGPQPTSTGDDFPIKLKSDGEPV